jgi:hypothetical protein
MTAKELKEALANVPDDAIVIMNPCFSGRENVVRAIYDEDNDELNIF